VDPRARITSSRYLRTRPPSPAGKTHKHALAEVSMRSAGVLLSKPFGGVYRPRCSPLVKICTCQVFAMCQGAMKANHV